MNATPSDYIGDACKILGFDRDDLLGPPLNRTHPYPSNRRLVFLQARKLAAGDYRTFVNKEWADAMGLSEETVRSFDRPRVERVRTGDIDLVVEVGLYLCGISRESLGGKCRHPDVVRCRMLITRAARMVTDCSFPEIARAIGRPNHSTVITANQRFDELTFDGRCPHLTDMLNKIVSECDRQVRAEMAA